jgi:hypothetical protein
MPDLISHAQPSAHHAKVTGDEDNNGKNVDMPKDARDDVAGFDADDENSKFGDEPDPDDESSFCNHSKGVSQNETKRIRPKGLRKPENSETDKVEGPKSASSGPATSFPASWRDSRQCTMTTGAASGCRHERDTAFYVEEKESFPSQLMDPDFSDSSNQ